MQTEAVCDSRYQKQKTYFSRAQKRKFNLPQVAQLTPVDGVKRLGSFESTRDHVLIPSNIQGHSNLSSTNVEQPTMSPNKGG